MYRFDAEAYDARVDWFRKARFGMFIHWAFTASRDGVNGSAASSRCRKKNTFPILKASLQRILILFPGPGPQRLPAWNMWS